jgi:hypothetical protein
MHSRRLIGHAVDLIALVGGRVNWQWEAYSPEALERLSRNTRSWSSTRPGGAPIRSAALIGDGRGPHVGWWGAESLQPGHDTRSSSWSRPETRRRMSLQLSVTPRAADNLAPAEGNTSNVAIAPRIIAG